jgi:hypothetical protein
LLRVFLILVPRIQAPVSDVGANDRSAAPLLVAIPFHFNGITFFCVSKLRIAFVGMTQRFAVGARQVDVGRLDHDRIRHLFDLHNPVEWMFSFFLLLQVPRQIKNFGFVR